MSTEIEIISATNGCVRLNHWPGGNRLQQTITVDSLEDLRILMVKLRGAEEQIMRAQESQHRREMAEPFQFDSQGRLIVSVEGTVVTALERS